MPDSFKVRIQRGLARDDVKIYEMDNPRPIAVVPREMAENYVDLYELLPLGFCHAMADFDESGSTFTLRQERAE